MRWTRASLGELSGGSGWRAAGILVLAHLAPLPLMLGIWALGLLPVFDDARWFPTSVAVVVGLVLVVGLFLRFGMWGTPASGGSDHGEKYMATFSPGVGFGLGWLRWLLQIVAVAVVLVPFVMIWTDLRTWHLFGTDELRALPDRAAAVPVPDDWVLVDTESTGFGLADIGTWPDEPGPYGRVERTFEVPAGFTFDELEQWMRGPSWTERGDSEPFGAIELEGCDTDNLRCDARLVPPAGAQPEHFVRATLAEPTSEYDETEVEVLVRYRQWIEPDWDVSDETVERAMAIPVPSDWVRHTDANAEETNSGERFSQVFGVPESTTREDVEAWLAGPQWTDPPSGAPFGAVEVDYCRETGPGELDRTYLCSVLTVRTEGSTGPVESMLVSLHPDQRVRISLSRNG